MSPTLRVEFTKKQMNKQTKTKSSMDQSGGELPLQMLVMQERISCQCTGHTDDPVPRAHTRSSLSLPLTSPIPTPLEGPKEVILRDTNSMLGLVGSRQSGCPSLWGLLVRDATCSPLLHHSFLCGHPLSLCGLPQPWRSPSSQPSRGVRVGRRKNNILCHAR